MSNNQNNQNNKQNIEDIASKFASAVLSELKDKDKTNTKSVGVLTVELDNRVKRKEQRQKSYATKIRKDLAENKNCCMVSFPQIYKEYQPNFVISICNCTVKIPADGKPYKLHNDYAAIFYSRLAYLDKRVSESNKNDVTQMIL